MHVPTDVVCRVCKRIFCCIKCCQKHEKNVHARSPPAAIVDEKNTGENVYPFCPICVEKPFLLRPDMYEEVSNICQKHLPLHCKKCAKVYTKLSELKHFSKCLQQGTTCSAQVQDQPRQVDDTSLSTVIKVKLISQATISTQTSPMPACQNEASHSPQDTPVSLLNLHWKTAKQKANEEFISDSVSSIKNLSSISNSSVAVQCGYGTAACMSIIAPTNTNAAAPAARSKGKLVRSTSTPVQAEMTVLKPKQQRTFNVTSGPVSSIYNSGCESEHSPLLVPHSSTSPSSSQTQAPTEALSRYRNVAGRAKILAATPLRQVMSKSIQKALAEGRGFEEPVGSNGHASAWSPLDLRLSPALRRTQSENCTESSAKRRPLLNTVASPVPVRREILLSSKHLTTESIVITKTQHRRHQQMQMSSNAAVTEDLSILGNVASIGSARNGNGRMGGSVYQTCHSIKIITSTELSKEMSIQEGAYAIEQVDAVDGMRTRPLLPIIGHNVDGEQNSEAFTPVARLPGGASINKKLIKFDTPKPSTNEIDANAYVTDLENVDPEESSLQEVEMFYTPNATPRFRRKIDVHLPHKRPPIHAAAAPQQLFNNEAFTEDYTNNDDGDYKEACEVKQECLEQIELSHPIEKAVSRRPGRLWSFVRSVMLGLSSQRTRDNNKTTFHPANSLIRRCASIAGSFVHSKSLEDEQQLQQTLKRKRTLTMDSQLPTKFEKQVVSPGAGADGSDTMKTKRYRVQARKPLERMLRDNDSSDINSYE